MGYNIIFDIDQTIVDSSSAESYRNNGDWESALHEIDAGNVKPFTGMVELIRDAWLYGHNIAFVSTSPERYCRRIFQILGLNPDDYSAFIPYHRDLYQGNKTEMYQRAIEGFSNKYQPLVIVGDSDNDIRSANGLEYQYKVFTIRCLWGLSDESIEHDLEEEGHPNATYPYLIMKEISELRDFLYYKWSTKTDANDVAYAFNYFPTGTGRFHDIFSKYYQSDIKGYDVFNVFHERKPVDIKKWATQFLISYIEDVMEEQHIDNAGRVGVMIVPSSREGHWNSALDEILEKVAELKGVTNCAHIMVRHTERLSAHNSNDRTVETNVNTMRIDQPEALTGLSVLIILDDITTSGNTYQACDTVIERDAEGKFDGVIKHVALAKTKNLHYEGNRNNTCEAEQVTHMDALNPINRRTDTFWAVTRRVNGEYSFNGTYHRDQWCERTGVKWGFVSMEGIRYYLPLDCHLCDRCSGRRGPW